MKHHEAIRPGIQICVGLDPSLHVSQGFLSSELSRLGDREFLITWGRSVLDNISPFSKCVKFQSAYYEARGSEGIAALEQLSKDARERGFYVILDAKRTDIGATLEAYGAYAFNCIDADALTVTPYMGLEVFAKLSKWLDKGKTIIVVWLTSNVVNNRYQQSLTISQNKAESAAALIFDQIPTTAGIVCGAQRFESLDPSITSQLLSHMLLVPGLGAQKGEISKDWIERLSNSPSPVLVSYSRGVHGDISTLGLDSNGPQDWSEYGSYILENTKKINGQLGAGL